MADGNVAINGKGGQYHGTERLVHGFTEVDKFAGKVSEWEVILVDVRDNHGYWEKGEEIDNGQEDEIDVGGRLDN